MGDVAELAEWYAVGQQSSRPQVGTGPCKGLTFSVQGETLEEQGHAIS